MNLFAIIGLSISFFCLALASIIFRYAQNQTQRIWGIFNIIVGAWAFGTFLVGIAKNPMEAILYWKLSYIPGTFISIVFYHLVNSICDLKRKKFLIFSYLQGIIFLPIIFSSHFINSTALIFNSIQYHIATGCFTLWFCIWSIIAYQAFYTLLQFIKKTQGLDKVQALYLFWGMLLGFVGGTSTLIPVYGIPFYPFLQITICIYSLIMTYAIFKYQMLYLSIVIKQSLVYSLLIAATSLTYLIVIVIFEKILQGFFGYQSIAISIFAAFLLGIIFIPLRNKIQNFIDRFFYKGSPEEVARENEFLRREVEETDRLKSIATLASGMAHEIKNPLTAIKTFSEFLPQRLEDKEFLKNFSKIVGSEVDRIDHLVNQLLEFAKPAAPKFIDTDLVKLLDDVLDFLNSEFIKHKIQVVKNFSQENILLRVDPNLFKQAILNIILNAIDVMHDGGTLTMSIEISTKNSTNPINARNSITFIKITIADTGPGIAPDDIPRIFDPFYTTKDHGTGLGLSITHGIIQSHGGTIRVQSEVGKGTEFVIEFALLGC